ncbi:MAG: PqqD family protein [Pseudomonadota bacterium]
MNVTIDDAVCARSGVFATAIDEELVLLDPKSGQYFGAGPVGVNIWNILSKHEEGVTVDAVCKEVMQQFEIDPETCRYDVLSFLNDLISRDLIYRL